MVAKSVHPGGAATASTVSTEPAPGAAGGGTAWIDLATSQTHTGYVNHDINLPKNPNHAVEVAHEKINFDRGNTLCRLTKKIKPILGNIFLLRDTYNADGTMALVANTIYCGMNWPMSTVYPGFGEYAYTLAGRDRAKGYYSFGHGPGPPTTGSWIPPAILPISSGTTPAWAGL